MEHRHLSPRRLGPELRQAGAPGPRPTLPHGRRVHPGDQGVVGLLGGRRVRPEQGDWPVHRPRKVAPGRLQGRVLLSARASQHLQVAPGQTRADPGRFLRGRQELRRQGGRRGVHRAGQPLRRSHVLQRRQRPGCGGRPGPSRSPGPPRLFPHRGTDGRRGGSEIPGNRRPRGDERRPELLGPVFQ